MHVCMLVTSNVIKDPRVQKEAQFAADSGFEVTVIGRVDNRFDQEPLKNRSYDVILIPILRDDNDSLPIRVVERARFLQALYKHSVALQPDIIHANDFDTLPPAFYAGRKLGVPVVYDAHEIWTEHGTISQIPPLKWVVQQYEKHLITQTAQTVSVSNAAASKLAEMYKIPRPQVITNCPYSFHNRSLVSKNPGFEVLYHGQFYPNRGYEEFCLAAQYLPEDITLVLRGYGPCESGLREIVSAAGKEHVVRFDNPVAVSEMTVVAAQSHVGVVLTRPVNINFKYTVSNKVFEYVQAGLPVIMSDVPEHRYLVDQYGIGVILTEVTPQKIASAIIALKSDTELYLQLRENVLRAAEVLCWEKEGPKLIEIYEKVVAL